MTRALITCSPHFVDLALNELRRYHPQICILEQPAPGYIFLQVPCSFDKLTAPWRHQNPIYLHHAFPVHAILDDVTQLNDAIHQFDAPTIQVRSLIEPAFAEIASPISLLHPPSGRILSILMTENRAYTGISWATQNLSPYAGGQRPLAETVPNRAGLKLLEALDTFSIHLRKGDHALDLGAAPGAWTTILRRRDLRVTAVAPTELYGWLMEDQGVDYHSTCAEPFLEHCQTTFDLIVNDMKMDARDSARLMVGYARHLRQEGIAIMTLKLRGENQPRDMDHAFRILRKAYKIIRVRQLVSNRKEVTLFLRRKS